MPYQAQGSISSFSISRSHFQSLTSAGCAADNLRTFKAAALRPGICAPENGSLTRKGTKKAPKIPRASDVLPAKSEI